MTNTQKIKIIKKTFKKDGRFAAIKKFRSFIHNDYHFASEQVDKLIQYDC